VSLPVAPAVRESLPAVPAVVPSIQAPKAAAAPSTIDGLIANVVEKTTETIDSQRYNFAELGMNVSGSDTKFEGAVVIAQPFRANVPLSNAAAARGKIVIVTRDPPEVPQGERCSFDEKAKQCLGAGAIGMLIANTSDEVNDIDVAVPLSCGMITATYAAGLKEGDYVMCDLDRVCLFKHQPTPPKDVQPTLPKDVEPTRQNDVLGLYDAEIHKVRPDQNLRVAKAICFRPSDLCSGASFCRHTSCWSLAVLMPPRLDSGKKPSQRSLSTSTLGSRRNCRGRSMCHRRCRTYWLKRSSLSTMRMTSRRAW
jgi:hypothetical protein